MKESSAWATLRSHLKRKGLHVQRIEDAISSGVPDTNLCYKGVETWLEGKIIRRLPKRETTPAYITLSKEQAGWLTARRLAGGRCYVWVRVANIGWLLIDDEFYEAKAGLPWAELLQKHSFFKTARECADNILNRG